MQTYQITAHCVGGSVVYFRCQAYSLTHAQQIAEIKIKRTFLRLKIQSL